MSIICRQIALLVGGDTAALLLFAAVGRRNHGEGLQLLQTVNTALPFLVGLSLLVHVLISETSCMVTLLLHNAVQPAEKRRLESCGCTLLPAQHSA